MESEMRHEARQVPSWLIFDVRQKMALKLIDLIRLAGVELRDYKIHLATGWPNPPLTAYFDGRFKEWQEYQNRRNFQCALVVSLIHRHGDRWLFVGVWRILGVTERSNPEKTWYEYSTSEVPGLEHLSGRAEISFARTFRASYLHGGRFGPLLEVAQIFEEKLSMGEFPGYSSVLIRFDQLRHVVRQNLAGWRSALRSVAGVYLITDTSCGRLYVGSASGIEGIWGRWCAYAANGHGGNRDLKALLKEKGDAHAAGFQFSILEICDVMATNDEVLTRESHWKDVLYSRQFGYNLN